MLKRNLDEPKAKLLSNVCIYYRKIIEIVVLKFFLRSMRGEKHM